MSINNPLTSNINALTEFANSVTGESDTNLSDAVHTLADGYGQGGESNTVTGTFTGTAEGSIDIDLAYEGEGYPISVMIYPSVNGEATFKATVQLYAVGYYACFKEYLDYAPSYTGTRAFDFSKILYRYKSSSNDASRYGDASGQRTLNFWDKNANDGAATFVFIRSNTKMSVYIRGTTGYGGFMPNVEYEYVVAYSDVNTGGGGDSGDSGLTLTWYDGEVV